MIPTTGVHESTEAQNRSGPTAPLFLLFPVLRSRGQVPEELVGREPHPVAVDVRSRPGLPLRCLRSLLDASAEYDVGFLRVNPQGFRVRTTVRCRYSRSG